MNFDLAVCTLSERDADGFIRCQADAYGSEGTAPSREVFQPFGIGGRPKARASGIGAPLLVMRHGDDVRAMPGPDPRWQSVLPNFGDGGMPLYATTERSGAREAPYLAFFGEGVEEAEGLFRLHVPAASGQTRLEVEPSAGDMTLTHASGATKLTMDDSEIKAGDDSAKALVNEDFMTWVTGTLLPALSGYSGNGPINVSPPGAVTTTKFKAT